MREVISIHIGHAGSQIGNTSWQLYCLEHEIDMDGIIQDTPSELKNFRSDDYPVFRNSFFSEKDGMVKARAIYVDLDPNSIDEIRVSSHGKLYHSESLISGSEGASNNFARGRGVGGNTVLENCMDRIKRMVGDCESLQGFMIFSSLNGGTGSGFRELLMERLSVEFAKKSILSFDILESPSFTSSCVEPYNVLFGLNSVSEYSDASIVVENEAINDLCKNSLGVESPTKEDLNELIAQLVSETTVSMRKDGSLNVNINEIITNLVPYPSVNFLIGSLAPLLPKKNGSFSGLSVTDITKSCFFDNLAMAKCDLLSGDFMACTVQYRGDVVPKDVGGAISSIKTSRRIKFVDWCPTGFKCGINYEAQKTLPNGNLHSSTRSVYLLANSTAVSQVFSRIENNFDKMYSERAFVHWYLREGMEEGEFGHYREALRTIQKDYEEVERKVDEEDEN